MLHNLHIFTGKFVVRALLFRDLLGLDMFTLNFQFDIIHSVVNFNLILNSLKESLNTRFRSLPFRLIWFEFLIRGQSGWIGLKLSLYIGKNDKPGKISSHACVWWPKLFIMKRYKGRAKHCVILWHYRAVFTRWGRGEGSSYNGLYGDAPPERGTFLDSRYG